MVPEPPIAPSSATSGLGLGGMIPLELPFRQHHSMSMKPIETIRGLLLDIDGTLLVNDEPHPDWLVVGDIGKGFTWERLNAAFRWLLDGASLLALHKNRYWHAGAEEGLVLDAGAFVAALEYSAGVTAEVVGKPSVAFFELALAELGLPAPQVLVVGDDVETDIVGGAAAGCRTALVRTGKFTGDPGELSARRPDLIVDSVSDLALPLG